MKYPTLYVKKRKLYLSRPVVYLSMRKYSMNDKRLAPATRFRYTATELTEEED